MNTIEATYRVTTPMFLGGADNERAEFRLPSFKGALRFWWRALAWQRLGGDLEEIRAQEAQLFGSADREVGQAKFLLDVDGDFPEPIPVGEALREHGDNGKKVDAGACYLGYGVMDFKGKLTRECLPGGFEFRVRLALEPAEEKLEKKRSRELRDALACLGMFGGLGSKSRKGYGSLALRAIDGESIAVTPQTYARQLSHLASRQDGVSGQPRYTAWSDQMRVGAYLGPSSVSALGLLDAVGQELIWLRSNGRVPRRGAAREVLGEPVDPQERRFWADHDMMAVVASRGTPVNTHPERVAFGLPHNYYFSSAGKADVQPAEHDRRASALFLHVHHFDTHGPTVIVSFWPADFLPHDEKIRVGRTRVDVSQNGLWKPIGDFFDALAIPRNDEHVFTQLR